MSAIRNRGIFPQSYHHSRDDFARLRLKSPTAREMAYTLPQHGFWYAKRTGRFLLTAARYPGVAQVACFTVLYLVAKSKWDRKFAGVWEPAFPKAWTAWFLVLVVIPVFALVQLVWLLSSTLVLYIASKRGIRSRYRSTRPSVVFDAEETQVMLQERDGEDSPRPGTPPQSTKPTPQELLIARLPALSSILWWVQIVTYSWLICMGLWEINHYENEGDIRFRPALQRALSEHDRDPNGYARGERIYIAAAFFNNQDILPYWTNTMLDVIAYLGPRNVFVSVVENNSGDRTPELLRELDAKLGALDVQRRISIGDLAVPKPDDMAWNNRIEFLAAIRNRALEPLVERGGYDRVIFSNDVFIEPESVIELLETADGKYDMACALDFGHFGAYDMWVLRDRIGRLTSGIWPYFFDAASYQAIKAGEPVPVFTCWNGFVVFAADPLLPVHLRSNRTMSTGPLHRPPPATHPLASTIGESPALTPPLRFRASPRGEGCFSSESFLLPYDMRRIMDMSRIYANPRVITAYGWHFYVWFKWVLQHRYMRWFVENVYDGAWMQYSRMIVGDSDKVYTWDGGDCHPWWYGDWW